MEDNTMSFERNNKGIHNLDCKKKKKKKKQRKKESEELSSVSGLLSSAQKMNRIQHKGEIQQSL